MVSCTDIQNCSKATAPFHNYEYYRLEPQTRKSGENHMKE